MPPSFHALAAKRSATLDRPVDESIDADTRWSLVEVQMHEGRRSRRW